MGLASIVENVTIWIFVSCACLHQESHIQVTAGRSMTWGNFQLVIDNLGFRHMELKGEGSMKRKTAVARPCMRKPLSMAPRPF